MNKQSLTNILEWALDQITLDTMNPTYEIREVDQWDSILFDLAVLAEHLGNTDALDEIEELIADVNLIRVDLEELL